MTKFTPASWEEAEKRYSERLESVELVQELDLETKELKRLVSTQVEWLGSRGVAENYPCTLTCFLALVGSEVYHRGNFWGEIAKELSLRQELSTAERELWGRCFERTIRLKGLADFSGIGGHRYVAQILLHGGIPEYCLRDLFENLITPAICGRLPYDGDVEPLLEEWQTRPSLFDCTDRPVRRFLLHGGKAAHDLLGRCLQATELLLEGEASDAEGVGLPAKMLSLFQRWWGEEPRGRTRGPSSRRFSPPQIRLEPHAGALMLYLPAQPAEVAEGCLVAEIRIDERTAETVHVPISHGSGFREAEGLDYPLEEPFERLRVRLLDGSKKLREWRFDGRLKDEPWLVFDAKSLRLLPGKTITKPCVWLLTPEGTEVSPDGGRVVARRECWGNHVAEKLELGPEGKVSLRKASGAGAGREIPTAQYLCQQAALHDSSDATEHRWPRLRSRDVTNVRVYTGGPPKLLVPAPKMWNRRCTLEVVARPRRACFEGQRKISLGADPADTVRQVGSHYEIPLSALLGEEPYGIFNISVRGRLGHDASFNVCVLPRLRVEVGPMALVGIGQRIEFVFRWGADVHMSPAGDAQGCQLEKLAGESRAYRLSLDRGVAAVPLRVRLPGNGQGTELTFTLEAPLMKWAFTSRDGSGPIRYSTETIRVPLADIIGAEDPAVLLYWPFPNEAAAQLVLQGEDQVRNHKLRRGLNRLPLACFGETLSAVRSREATLELVTTLEDGREVRRPIIAVGLGWAPSAVRAAMGAGQSPRAIKVSWKDKFPRSSRMIRVWGVSQAARELLGEARVQDGETCARIELDKSALAETHYRLEFTGSDDWQEPTFPDDFARNICDFQLVNGQLRQVETSRQRYEELLEGLKEPSFEAQEIIATFRPCTLAEVSAHDPSALHDLVRAVYERWRRKPAGTEQPVWDRGCVQLVGALVSGREDLLEAAARALEQTDSANNSALHAWWVQAMLAAGALFLRWGDRFRALVKRASEQRLPMRLRLEGAALGVQELYRCAKWASPQSALCFLSSLRSHSQGLYYSDRRVVQLSAVEFDGEPWLAVAVSDKQRGVPRRVRLDPSVRYIPPSRWYDVRPRQNKWRSAEQFITARIVRAIALGIAACPEEARPLISSLALEMCDQRGATFLKELVAADEEVVEWVQD